MGYAAAARRGRALGSQLAMDFPGMLPPPAARATDPDTSHAAAAAAAAFQSTHADTILAALQDYGPMTVDQIATVTRLESQQINKRLTEMQRSQPARAIPSGIKRKSASGVLSRVWKAAI